jgi:polysaccharide biosynthesis/export protein
VFVHLGTLQYDLNGFAMPHLTDLQQPSAGINVGPMTQFGPFAKVFAVWLLLALCTVCRAAEVPIPGDQQQMTVLGPGDSVSIQVSGQPDATNTYVGDDGTISVPLAGNIQVAGVSPVEAAARIAKALKDGGYFVDPHVTMLITQTRSQLVSVIGEVQNSGRYLINPRTTIVDLLAQAGGAKETAADIGYVLRSDGTGHVSRYPVNLNGLTDVKGALPMPTLSGGDSLVVPRAEHFYVTGAVTTPGTYKIEPGITVIQGIARAGGINERGSEQRIQLKRMGKNSQYQVIKVKPGDPIQADDIIRVKESIF